MDFQQMIYNKMKKINFDYDKFSTFLEKIIKS